MRPEAGSERFNPMNRATASLVNSSALQDEAMGPGVASVAGGDDRRVA